MAKKELTNIKRTIKKATGRNLNSFDIEAWGDDFAVISYYKSGYDRASGNKTLETVTI